MWSRDFQYGRENVTVTLRQSHYQSQKITLKCTWVYSLRPQVRPCVYTHDRLCRIVMFRAADRHMLSVWNILKSQSPILRSASPYLFGSISSLNNIMQILCWRASCLRMPALQVNIYLIARR